MPTPEILRNKELRSEYPLLTFLPGGFSNADVQAVSLAFQGKAIPEEVTAVLDEESRKYLQSIKDGEEANYLSLAVLIANSRFAKDVKDDY